MKPAYLNLGLAAGGVLAVAVAAGIARKNRSVHQDMIAETTTVALPRAGVAQALTNEQMLRSAVGCEGIEITRDPERSRLIEWACPAHAHERARLALIDAPADRGTEVHLSMAGRRCDARAVVRRLKTLLETGEIATGARQ